MSFATKMYLSIIAILVAVILGVCLAWQHAKNVASEAEHKLELSEVKALTQKERETRLLEKLNSKHAEEIAEMAINALKVEQDYKEQLNEIKLRVTAANSVNERLRDQIRTLNGKLSELPERPSSTTPPPAQTILASVPQQRENWSKSLSDIIQTTNDSMTSGQPNKPTEVSESSTEKPN